MKDWTEELIGKPFHPMRLERVRDALDITHRTRHKDDGVSIVIAMTFRNAWPEKIEFGIAVEGDIAVRRTEAELIADHKEDGEACFTDNERFGFERTYGLTVEAYRKIALDMPERPTRT